MRPLTDDLVAFICYDTRAETTLRELADSDLTDQQVLPTLMRLREQYTPDEAAALLDQARLRQHAIEKFPDAANLFFTKEALQQSTSLAIARYRAQRFAGYRRVADLGCGIGADTLALAEVVPKLIAVEKDPIRAQLARVNVERRGVADRVEVHCADWTTLQLDIDAAFVDPSRRVEGRRVFSVDDLVPPLSTILALRERVPNIAVKVMPGIADDEIPPNAEVEFISDAGTCKEATLFFGDFTRGVARTATLLPGPFHLDSSMHVPAGSVPVREPADYLYEPDAAVIRATLVRHLAVQIGASQLDPRIAYLTGDECVESPFVRVWRVHRHGAFHLKRLNRWLRELEVSEVIVKKRGSPIEPEAFRRRLKTVEDGTTGTVFFTRVKDRPWMILAEDV